MAISPKMSRCPSVRGAAKLHRYINLICNIGEVIFRTVFELRKINSLLAVNIVIILVIVCKHIFGFGFFEILDELHKIGGVDPVVTVHNLKVFADCIANTAVNGGAVTAVFL